MNPIAEQMYARRPVTPETRIGVGVGVIIRRADGQILIEKRGDSGMWGLCGGRIEPGESIAAAALREVREETALTVRLTRLIGVYSEPANRIVTFLDNGDVIHKLDVIVEAEIVSGEVVRSHESEALQFFPTNALPWAEVCPPARAPLEDYVAGRTGVLK